MQEEARFTIYVEQLQGYEFKVKFDWDQAQEVLLDEAAPLGQQQGPNASRLLAAAVANCLSASLLFCLKKNAPKANSVTADVTCILARNENQRLRIGGMEVAIAIDPKLFDDTRLKRCLDMFEDFCIVTASIRRGVPVKVSVVDPQGRVLHEGE